MAAHPRSRGEHAFLEVPGKGNFGSSPLTRGTRQAGELPLAALGLIPAHAGNTTPPPTAHAASPAHPRSRGEHRLFSPHPGRGLGSSPLTRGTLGGAGQHARGGGLIPAHAGNTSRRFFPCFQRAAHPRSRGEHGRTITGYRRRYGSSPLTRGTLKVSVHSFIVDRLIPAHAGNTFSGMRGGLAETRLIPAHAGNTGVRGGRPESRPAHPRSRGEHSRSQLCTSSRGGSSPLTRGTLPGRTGDDSGARLIPAHAGNTVRSTAS